MKKIERAIEQPRGSTHPVLRLSLSLCRRAASSLSTHSRMVVRRSATCARDIGDGADESESAFDACAFIRTCGKL